MTHTDILTELAIFNRHGVEVALLQSNTEQDGMILLSDWYGLL